GPRAAICLDRPSKTGRDRNAMSLARRWVSIVLCAFTLCGVGCPKRAARAASLRRDNGLRVELLATSGGDKAALALLFDVGADHDPPGRSGMAHLIEHL